MIEIRDYFKILVSRINVFESTKAYFSWKIQNNEWPKNVHFFAHQKKSCLGECERKETLFPTLCEAKSKLGNLDHPTWHKPCERPTKQWLAWGSPWGNVARFQITTNCKLCKWGQYPYTQSKIPLKVHYWRLIRLKW
jgi:hypothetical protein